MTQTFLQNLREGMFNLFENNEKVITIGEDITDPYGGAFKVTSGLSTKYPNRVLSSPISEAAIIGVASGLALEGFKPIVEIMFGDFITLCADQLINHASKFPLMFNDAYCPLIIRTPMGGGRGYGPTHSQSIEKIFFGIPGLKTIAPSLFHKPGSTLNRISELESGPIIFIENKLLYSEKIVSDFDTFNIKIFKEQGYEIVRVDNFIFGDSDVTIIAYGGSSRFIPEILSKMSIEEIRISVILPECIDPFPIHTVSELISLPSKVLILDEGYDGFNWASGVASLLYSSLWGKFVSPIRIVSSNREIIPTSFKKEANVLLNGRKIEAAILEELNWDN